MGVNQDTRTLVGAFKTGGEQKNRTYQAEVTRIDDEGVVWVNVAGSDSETPTAEIAAEVKRGDSVNVEWRNNKLYIAGNYSNPSAGLARTIVVENTANAAQSDATIAREAATSAVQSAATAGRAASIAQSAAEAAQATADIKKRVFTAQPAPPYNVGDLWVDLGSADFDLVTSAGDVLVDDQANALIAAVLGTGSETVVYVSTFARTAEESYTESDWSLAATDDAKVDELREWFWHDSLGAHVLGDATGYRNDITSTGMQIIDTSTDTETSVAIFGASGAQIGQNASGKTRTEISTSGMQIIQNASGTDTQIANLGYGQGYNAQGQLVDAPFYTLGTRFSGSAVGNYSTAEGYNAIASRSYAHAEGDATHAVEHAAHAEGAATTASGKVSHAEGANTTASGDYSHAEGYDAIADGDYSHAQNHGTEAGYEAQTAIGKYNDNKSANAFEIGNGTSSASSNALEVTWTGDLTAAGDITDGGGNVLSNKADLSAVITPVDYVIEQAPSGNWQYRKWHSGRVEAWFNDSITMSETTAQGNLYRRSATLAIPPGIFTISPGVIVGSQTSDNTIVSVKGSASSATSIAITDYRTNSLSSTQSRAIRVYAWQN